MSKYVLPNRVVQTVHDGEINYMFMPGGDTYQQMGELGRLHYYYARKLAPVRTGELLMAHEWGITPNSLRQCQYYVANFAEYAMAVAKGTIQKGQITSNKEFDFSGATYAQRQSRFGYWRFFPRRGMPVRRWRALGRGSYRGLMRVRHAPSSYYGEDWLRKSVKGQVANDWIDKAWDLAEQVWLAGRSA